MLKITSIIVIGTAALGLLFYWLRKRRKKGRTQVKTEEEKVANYGVQVMNQSGNLVNLTDRPVMVIDVINIPYGSDGTYQFNIPVSGVSIDADYEIDPASDGKFISVSYSGNRVSWQWHSAKALKPTNAKIIIFS